MPDKSLVASSVVGLEDELHLIVNRNQRFWNVMSTEPIFWMLHSKRVNRENIYIVEQTSENVKVKLKSLRVDRLGNHKQFSKAKVLLVWAGNGYRYVVETKTVEYVFGCIKEAKSKKNHINKQASVL